MASWAWALSLAVGFLSLSQEILWVRLLSFALQGASHAFALVLVLFLIGVAHGASVGKRWCEAGDDLLARASRALMLSAALDAVPVLLLPFIGAAPLQTALLLLLVMASASAKATVFPVAHHLGSQQSGPRLGRSVSKVYFANIVGCTLGPVVTGYVLLDIWPIETCLAAVAVGSALLATACARARARASGALAQAPAHAPAHATSSAPRAARTGAPSPAWPGALAAALAVASALMPAHALVRALSGEAAVADVLQNRHGIIHTVTGDGHGLTVFGGNAYDGSTSVDMRHNVNALDRALVLLAVHPQPERVLVLGMSAGAWTRILSASPQIRELVVLEINPAYIDLVRRSPQTAPLLDDPRVTVHIDDGRRWLRRHPDARFDLIVQNTTFHWRAYSNNLLSREHLALARAHLRPGGIMAWNSTFSGDALKTAEGVFTHVERRAGFIYGSDQAFATTRDNAVAVLRSLQLEGRPVFDEAAFLPGGLAASIVDQPFVAPERRYAGLNFRPATITDGNLLAEQAHGNPFLQDMAGSWFEAVDRWRAPAAEAPPARSSRP